MSYTSKQFYETLFDKEDSTCFGDNKFAIKTYQAIQTGQKENNRFFTINPLEKDSTRADKNISKYRNLMFEIDDYIAQGDDKKSPVPHKIQATIMHLCGLPFSTSLDTAGKSLHWIISLEDLLLTDRTEYDALWKAIQSVINKTAIDLGYNLVVDASTKNPSRFSRAPGALRTDTVATPAIQTIKSIRGRVHSSDVLAWLESHKVDWMDFMSKPSNFEASDFNPSSTDQDKIDFVLKYRMQDDRYEKGNRHHYQLKMAYNLLRTGMSSEAIDSYFMQAFGEISTGIVSVSKMDRSSLGNPIYVWSKEEKIAWAREQSKIEAEEESKREQAMFNNLLLEQEDDILINGEVANLNSRGLSQYIRVGTKHYRADAYSIELWDKQTIKDDFGPRAIHDESLRKFRAFVNEPNYLERIEHITKVVNGELQTFYNKFRFPDWELKKGEFPTTMKLLERVFVGESENQLEIGLDWIQLILLKPKQRTRALVLVGATEVGKDTFMEWLVRLVGANGILIGGEEIESPFNSSWAGKHIVCLNEVSYDLSDKKTKERIKNLLTGEKLTLEGKGDNRYQIENYTKVVMATNNAYDFMQISNTENRFWVREMVKFAKSDPTFVEKLKSEIPAFLYWIMKERKLWRNEKATRFWHSNEECTTTAGTKVVENTKTSMYDIIKGIFEDKFNHPLLTNEDGMYVRAKTITAFMNEGIYNVKDRYQEKAVRLCLLKEFDATDQKTERKDAYNNFESSNNPHFYISRSMIGLEKALPKTLEQMLN